MYICMYVHVRSFCETSEIKEGGTVLCLVKPPNNGHFGAGINSADLFFVKRFFLFGKSQMYCRNYTSTASGVLCREVCYTVFLFWRIRNREFHYSRDGGASAVYRW